MNRMLRHFRIIPFIAGIIIGLAVLFLYKSPQTITYEYPHPHNVNTRVYRDRNGICYKYNAMEVNCDENESNLKAYPIQS